ncbi:hypothetical protein SLEP1_g49379 [Rubroshorea leprosula]|uniref:Transposase n=1 Tax=Rubroshorea leprosula TaxID=152421 RepID=A0AAV5LZW9_9ROSI|nr:hypothetical protein SLEP1_g49379 [Rubroshorea leprosula]
MLIQKEHDEMEALVQDALGIHDFPIDNQQDDDGVHASHLDELLNEAFLEIKIPASAYAIKRLQRLSMSSKTSIDMRWHDEGCTTDGKLRHPANGEAWKEFDQRYPDFALDSRNISLGLASDGLNPFQRMSNVYGIWPVILIIYNLPTWSCMKQSSFILSMIISGPKSPRNDIDIYL